MPCFTLPMETNIFSEMLPSRIFPFSSLNTSAPGKESQKFEDSKLSE